MGVVHRWCRPGGRLPKRDRERRASRGRPQAESVRVHFQASARRERQVRGQERLRTGGQDLMGSTATESNPAATARVALEDVCSGRNLDGIPDVYHPDFVDHVNALEYRGHEGARRSVALYLELFPDLSFVVDEQVTEGDLLPRGGPCGGLTEGEPSPSAG